MTLSVRIAMDAFGAGVPWRALAPLVVTGPTVAKLHRRLRHRAFALRGRKRKLAA